MTELEEVILRSPKLSERTKAAYVQYVAWFLDFAGRDPSQWTGVVFEAWRDALAQRVSPATANTYLAAVRYASRRLAKRHQDPRLDFAAYAEGLPEIAQMKGKRALSLDEGQDLIEACGGAHPRSIRDARDVAICVLGLRTGLRRAGMCGITFADLRSPAIDVTLKGGRRYAVPADAEAWFAIDQLAGILRSVGAGSGALFRSLTAVRLDGSVGVRVGLTPDGLYKIVKGRAGAAGLRDVSPHVFRHTFVSWCRQYGVPDWKIADTTGHALEKGVAPMLASYTHDIDRERVPAGAAIPTLFRAH